MKEKIRKILTVDRGVVYGDIPGLIADLKFLVNQEVERRIAERMPSEEEINLYADWHSRKYEDDATQKSIAFTACRRAIKWLRSRLTNPGDSQKTEG